ncbi:MAG: TIGR02266 family protein [Deltaproteobacteria bacterium]|nr:TIGR02266 family protein [Deltaproteobacteria bacterium]
MEERRGHTRAPIKLQVEYQKVNSFLHDYAQNISKGGTFIKTQKPLPLGTEFVFKLRVPFLEEPLTLRGQVKWIGAELGPDETEGEGELGMGIEFVYKDDHEREQVHGRVQQLMVDQLGPLAYARLMEAGN